MTSPSGVEVVGVMRERFEEILTPDALAFGREPGSYDEARALFLEVAVADDFVDFLTLPAYERMP